MRDDVESSSRRGVNPCDPGVSCWNLRSHIQRTGPRRFIVLCFAVQLVWPGSCPNLSQARLVLRILRGQFEEMNEVEVARNIGVPPIHLHGVWGAAAQERTGIK